MSVEFSRIDFNDNTLIRIRRVTKPEDLGTFHCDTSEFNDYLGPEMIFDLKHHLTKIYSIEIAGIVAGYFDLTMAHLRNDATEAIIQKGIESNVPALLISRLAVDEIFQGHGVEKAMIQVILDKLIPKLKKFSGCRYLMLNPRDDAGVRCFYENLGFEYIARLVEGRPPDRERDAFLFDLIDVQE